MALLAVDAGRSEVETKSANGLRVFSSAVSIAGHMLNPQYLQGDLILEIEGKQWWVGGLADREGKRFKRNNFGASKADPILRVQVIAAAIYSGIVSGTIDLGVLVPVSGFTKEEKKKVREVLRGNHAIKYWLVEETKKKPVERTANITIEEKILIAQEGVAAYWSSPQDEYTQTFDFGAQTINYVCHNGDRTYVNDNSGTIHEGWEILKEKHGLRGIPDELLEESEAKRIADELAQKVIDEVKLKGWSPRIKTQVFGGVSHLVFPFIQKQFPKAVMSHHPRNGNVEGLYYLMEEVFSYA